MQTCILVIYDHISLIPTGLTLLLCAAPCLPYHTQKLNVKMDLVVSGISDLKERLVKLEDLPAAVRDGFKDVGSQISSFRKMVLQVGDVAGLGAVLW